MGIVLEADIAAALVCTAAISGSQEGEGKCFADIVERKYQRADSSAQVVGKKLIQRKYYRRRHPQKECRQQFR